MPSLRAPALYGYLEEHGCDELAGGRYQILEGQELVIGRDYETCDIVLTDLTVSNEHLKIYTVAYTEENHQRIFTYAKDLSTNGSYWRYKHDNSWKEFPIGQGNAVLLSNGDEVRLCNGSSFTFSAVPGTSQCPEEASFVRDEDAKLFMNLFRIMGRRLGSGAYGEVWMAVDIFYQRQVACKVVRPSESPQMRSGKVVGTLWREVNLLKDMSHPNILHIERVFFAEEKLFIISELVPGGDLMSYLERPWTNIGDMEACFIVYQILKALEYLHRQGICHRDLKPENILMSVPTSEARVVLADFGHSIQMSGGNLNRSRRMKTASVGTDYYVAPEVRGKKRNANGYTMAADMWSLGIISTLLLTGESVFEDSNYDYNSSKDVLSAAAECDLAKMDHGPLWQGVSNPAKDFVRGLLTLNETARLNVEQALEHGWITDVRHRENLQRRYKNAIRGWMPSRPILDFQEDLAVFREASRSTLDSTLMPPPARPNTIKFQQRSFYRLESDQRSSPFFPQTLQDSATKIVSRTSKERETKSGDEANKPSILPTPAIPINKRQRRDDLEHILIQCEDKKPTKSSVMQGLGGGHEHLSYVASDHHLRVQPSSIDLEYDECRLYDRVSREKAGIFRSAKNYRQSVDKRRLRD